MDHGVREPSLFRCSLRARPGFLPPGGVGVRATVGETRGPSPPKLQQVGPAEGSVVRRDSSGGPSGPRLPLASVEPGTAVQWEALGPQPAPRLLAPPGPSPSTGAPTSMCVDPPARSSKLQPPPRAEEWASRQQRSGLPLGQAEADPQVRLQLFS